MIERKEETKMFEVNKSYWMRSACDHEYIWVYKVIARTAKTITLQSDDGQVLRCRPKTWNDVEYCKPLGSGSMMPVLASDRVY